MSKKGERENIFKKSKGFLSQIPDWESDYKESDSLIIDFKRHDWTDAKPVFTEHALKVFGHVVMEDWETAYMRELSTITASQNGIVLEIGFGMGISANFLQQHDIIEHIIIEANKSIAHKAKEFGLKAAHNVRILEGFWEDVIEEISDNSLNGILFDAFPLTEDELYQNHFKFFPFAYRKLRPGGVFTYYSDEIRTFKKKHLQALLNAGFKLENIKKRTIKVTPPENCEYWKAKTIIAPIITK